MYLKALQFMCQEYVYSDFMSSPCIPLAFAGRRPLILNSISTLFRRQLRAYAIGKLTLNIEIFVAVRQPFDGQTLVLKVLSPEQNQLNQLISICDRCQNKFSKPLLTCNKLATLLANLLACLCWEFASKFWAWSALACGLAAKTDDRLLLGHSHLSSEGRQLTKGPRIAFANPFECLLFARTYNYSRKCFAITGNFRSKYVEDCVFTCVCQ